MRGALRSFRGVMVGLLALLLAGSALLGQARLAAADFQFTYLEGLEQAVSRNYFGDDYEQTGYLSIEISASVARFDAEANAEAGYDEVTSQYAGGFASYEPGATPEASPVDDLGDVTTAFTSVSYTEMLLEWWMDSTVLVTRDADLIYVVSVTFQLDEEPQASETMPLARDLMASMLGAEAGEGEGVVNPDGTSSGGLWDKLPTLDHEALQPLALAYAWDYQDYPEVELADTGTPTETEVAEEDELDFGAMEGIQRAVGRSYTGDMSALTTPEAVPAGTYFLAVAVASFDSDDNASAALGIVNDEIATGLGEDFPFTLEEGDAGDLGDEAVTWFGAGEEEGITYEVTYLAVRDGSYIYLVAAVGIGEESGTLDSATAVAEAMLDADAGEGDGTFDESGGSTGGLWDKLPAEGDAVLEGLTVESDEVIYPEPEE